MTRIIINGLAARRTHASPRGAEILFLHIGRGKSGSSTIQSLAREHAQFMASEGVSCPLTLHGVPNHSRLAAALCNPKADPQTLKRLRKDLQRSPHPKVFVSAEALFSITRDGIMRLKRLLGDRQIRILAYVREYPGWLQSVYAQRTKRATNVLDFDAYFESVREQVSVFPRLERWASVFGWEALRVRPLDPAALVGGDLIVDVLDGLGVATPVPDVPALNVAPHWMTLELLRALAMAAGAGPIGKVDSRSARVIRQMVDRCTADLHPSRVQYFTREQWRELADRFRRDMTAVGRLVGTSLPVSLQVPGDRPFLPTFEAIPDAVKADILSKIRHPRQVSRIQPEILALAERLLTTGELTRGAAHTPPPSAKDAEPLEQAF